MRFALIDYKRVRPSQKIFIFGVPIMHNRRINIDITDIQKQCESLSNEELVLVVNNKILYTEKIVRAAYQEIRRRSILKDEIKKIEKDQARRSKIITGDIYEDIFLLEKIAFYFIFVPRFHFLVLRDYWKKKYILKVRQAAYFNLFGAIFFFLDLFLLIDHISLITAAIIWPCGFLSAYALNKYYFKQRTIRRLEARTIGAEEALEESEQLFYP